MSNFTRPLLLGQVINCLLEFGSRKGLSIREILEKVKFSLAGNRSTCYGQPKTVALVRRALKYGINSGLIRYCNGRFRLAIEKSKAQCMFTKKFDMGDYVKKICNEYRKVIRKRGNTQSGQGPRCPEKRPSQNSKSKTAPNNSKQSIKSRKSNNSKKVTQPRRRGRPAGRPKNAKSRRQVGKSKSQFLKKTKSRIRRKPPEKAEKVDRKRSKKSQNEGSLSDISSASQNKSQSEDEQPKRKRRRRPRRKIIDDEESKNVRSKTRQNRNCQTAKTSFDKSKSSNQSCQKKESTKTQKTNQKSDDKSSENQKATNEDVDPAVKQMIVDNLEAVRPSSKNKMLQRKDLTHGPTLSDFSE